jgi:hypothetical protein
MLIGWGRMDYPEGRAGARGRRGQTGPIIASHNKGLLCPYPKECYPLGSGWGLGGIPRFGLWCGVRDGQRRRRGLFGRTFTSPVRGQSETLEASSSREWRDECHQDRRPPEGRRVTPTPADRETSHEPPRQGPGHEVLRIKPIAHHTVFQRHPVWGLLSSLAFPVHLALHASASVPHALHCPLILQLRGPKPQSCPFGPS